LHRRGLKHGLVSERPVPIPEDQAKTEPVCIVVVALPGLRLWIDVIVLDECKLGLRHRPFPLPAGPRRCGVDRPAAVLYQHQPGYLHLTLSVRPPRRAKNGSSRRRVLRRRKRNRDRQCFGAVLRVVSGLPADLGDRMLFAGVGLTRPFILISKASAAAPSFFAARSRICLLTSVATLMMCADSIAGAVGHLAGIQRAVTGIAGDDPNILVAQSQHLAAYLSACSRSLAVFAAAGAHGGRSVFVR